LLDVMLEYHIDRESRNLHPASAGLSGTCDNRVALLPLNGARSVALTVIPGLDASLEPDGGEAASRCVLAGTTHILDGIDHLLFLLCHVRPRSGKRVRSSRW
jgi:hypothetical protein